MEWDLEIRGTDIEWMTVQAQVRKIVMMMTLQINESEML